MSVVDTDSFISNFNAKVQALKQKIEERLQSEKGFKTKVTENLSDIKTKLLELQKKKEELKKVVEKAASITSETDDKIRQQQAEIDSLKTELQKINDEKTSLQEELEETKKQLADRSDLTKAQVTDLQNKQKELEDEITRINAENAGTSSQVEELKTNIAKLTNDNDKLKQTMSESLGLLQESLTALDSDKLNPDEIKVAYDEIVSIINDLGSIIEGSTSYPPSSSSLSSPLLTDDSLVNIAGLPASTTYRGVINLLNDKANQNKSNPNNKYKQALDIINANPNDLNALKNALTKVTIKNGIISGGKKTRKVKKTRKMRKNKKQTGDLTNHHCHLGSSFLNSILSLITK